MCKLCIGWWQGCRQEKSEQWNVIKRMPTKKGEARETGILDGENSRQADFWEKWLIYAKTLTKRHRKRQAGQLVPETKALFRKLSQKGPLAEKNSQTEPEIQTPAKLSAKRIVSLALMSTTRTSLTKLSWTKTFPEAHRASNSYEEEEEKKNFKSTHSAMVVTVVIVWCPPTCDVAVLWRCSLL